MLPAGREPAPHPLWMKFGYTALCAVATQIPAGSHECFHRVFTTSAAGPNTCPSYSPARGEAAYAPQLHRACAGAGAALETGGRTAPVASKCHSPNPLGFLADAFGGLAAAEETRCAGVAMAAGVRQPEADDATSVAEASADEDSRPRVLILGGGFAGLGAAQKLKHADVDVVLVDKHDYHTFQPLLYQVATDLLEPSTVGHPLRDLFGEQSNARVHRTG